MMLGLVDRRIATDTKCMTMLSHPVPERFEGTWSITPEIEALMISLGFQVLYDDLISQTVSVCGTEMTAASGYFADTVTTQYDGTGWIWPLYGGYTAPAVNFDEGCGDPTACNFDPCSIPDDASCTDLEVVAEVVGDLLTVQISGGSAPFTINVLNGELDPIGFPPATQEEPELVLVGLPDGVYCIEASDSFGCTAIACDTLGVTSIDDVDPLTFNILPNPANESVRLELPNAWDVMAIRLRDAVGREVFVPSLISHLAPIDISQLSAGTYFVEVTHSNGVAIERLVVRR